MENFTFFNPVKLHFGKGQIAKIGKEIATSGLRKVLIVAGGGSIKNNGVYDQVTESLKENNIAWAEYWGVSPNPTLTQAKAGIEALRNNCCQAVLAVGGGSVIDLSKAIVAGVYFDDIWDAYQFGSSITKALPLFTVLTISAAGSEMNTNSVLTNEKSNLKLAIHSPVLFPKCSIIDPSVQFSLPWKETVNGGVDSLSHIFEVYFSGTDQETTLSISEGLMNSIIL